MTLTIGIGSLTRDPPQSLVRVGLAAAEPLLFLHPTLLLPCSVWVLLSFLPIPGFLGRFLPVPISGGFRRLPFAPFRPLLLSLAALALSCVLGGGVSFVAYRAQLGRVGGSRWGWVLQIKFPCHTVGLSSANKMPCHMTEGFPFPSPLRRLGCFSFPWLLPPCPLLSVGGVGFRLSRNGVPAVLDLINQLLLCAPTCPASKLQRKSLVVDFAAQRPTTTNHRQASIRRGAGAASAEAVQRPAGLHQSLVVDLLLAASAHACSLHHHGHVPQPLRLMPAGMALTREPLAAVQRDAQGDCQCKSWWPPWYLAGRPVVVVQ